MSARLEFHVVDVHCLPQIGLDRMTYFLSLSRLAPVQAAWWGVPDTSGVPTIDYRLVSEYEHESFRDHYSEKQIFQFKYVARVESELSILSSSHNEFTNLVTVVVRGSGLFHSFPEPHDYTSSREHVRRAVKDRFGLPSDFHMYLSIEVGGLNCCLQISLIAHMMHA